MGKQINREIVLCQNHHAVALNYARKVAKNKPYRVFIKVKDSLGYKVLEVMDIIDLRLLDSKIKLTDNSFTIGKRLKVVVRG